MFTYWNDYYYIVIIFQAISVIHALKTGRNQWIYLLIFLPLVGAIAYFFMELLPDLRRGTNTKGLSKMVFPNNDIKEWERKVQLSDSVTNKLGLSNAYAAQQQYDKAIALSLECLSGYYADDPAILLQLAQQYFMKGEYQESIHYFNKLQSKSSTSLKSVEDELLYVRALAGAGETENAENGYKRLIRIHHSLEARYYYGIFLKAQGRNEEAKDQFQSIRTEIKLLPRYARKRNQKWQRLALKEIMLSK
jgi:hypothetical protein